MDTGRMTSRGSLPGTSGSLKDVILTGTFRMGGSKATSSPVRLERAIGQSGIRRAVPGGDTIKVYHLWLLGIFGALESFDECGDLGLIQVQTRADASALAKLQAPDVWMKRITLGCRFFV